MIEPVFHIRLKRNANIAILLQNINRKLKFAKIHTSGIIRPYFAENQQQQKFHITDCIPTIYIRNEQI